MADKRWPDDYSEKTSIVNADKIAAADSAGSDAFIYILFSTIKNTILKAINGLSEKTSLVDNDEFLINDSADSNNPKKVKQSTIDTQTKTVVRNDIIETGAGVPSSTPDFIGQIYIDTTAKRQYISTGTSSSADWDKVSVFKSGTVTVTGGGGDITVTLPWDWSGGILELHLSDAVGDYFDTGNAGNTLIIKTSYISLTSVTYTDGQDILIQRNDAALPEIFEIAKTGNSAGAPKSATTTTFVLDDNGADTKYVKWFVTA